jgi:hypothetical protein
VLPEALTSSAYSAAAHFTTVGARIPDARAINTKNRGSRFSTLNHHSHQPLLWPQPHAVRAALHLLRPIQKPTKLILSKKPASLQSTTRTTRIAHSDRFLEMYTSLKEQAAGGLSRERIWAPWLIGTRARCQRSLESPQKSRKRYVRCSTRHLEIPSENNYTKRKSHTTRYP